MDEELTFKNEGELSFEEAATVGVGALVSLKPKRWTGLVLTYVDGLSWPCSRTENAFGTKES